MLRASRTASLAPLALPRRRRTRARRTSVSSDEELQLELARKASFGLLQRRPSASLERLTRAEEGFAVTPEGPILPARALAGEWLPGVRVDADGLAERADGSFVFADPEQRRAPQVSDFGVARVALLGLLEVAERGSRAAQVEVGHAEIAAHDDVGAVEAGLRFQPAHSRQAADEDDGVRQPWPSEEEGDRDEGQRRVSGGVRDEQDGSVVGPVVVHGGSDAYARGSGLLP